MKGTRIRLTAMPDDPDPIMIGATGVVMDSSRVDLGGGDKFTQVLVKWDPPHEGRALMLSVPPDQFEVIVS